MRPFVAFGCTMLALSPLASVDGVRVPLFRAPVDACSLLTSADINAAMGVSMGAGKAQASKACQWRQPVKQGASGAIVDVTILDAHRFEIGKAVSASPKFKVTSVNGLGDDAYYSASTDGKLTTLRVKKGDAGFAVDVRGGDVPAAKAETEELALAKIIVAKF